MTYNNTLESGLRSLIEDNLDQIALPYVRNNSIRIKQYIIRKNKSSWLVYCIKNNSQIARVFSKTSAIAIAKTLTEGKSVIDQIIKYDQEIEKHYHDALIFRYFLDTSTNESKNISRRIRYDISKQKTVNIKKILDRYIFN